MNFLAHLFLSGKDPSVQVGNFMGDFVKGSELKMFPERIVSGIHLHRKIDAYTDSHLVVDACKNRLRKQYRHYSGVIVDVYFDHLLALNWVRYSSLPLENFAENAYKNLKAHEAILPEKIKFFLPRMAHQNWLVNYREFWGLERSLEGMARRARFNSGMEQSAKELKKDFKLYEREFNQFFPQLLVYCENIINAETTVE